MRSGVAAGASMQDAPPLSGSCANAGRAGGVPRGRGWRSYHFWHGFTGSLLMQAVQAVCRGDVERAFAVVRPPGHHAECARAMGFCFYNNVAVAAQAARQEPGVERVLVLDWDVHHGEPGWRRRCVHHCRQCCIQPAPPFPAGDCLSTFLWLGEGIRRRLGSRA